MRCRHCGQDIVSVYNGGPPGADGMHPREWVHSQFGRPECWIQTAVLPAGADPEAKAEPAVAGDYDPWWDVTTVWADGRAETKRMRRSEVSVYLVSIPPKYLAAFSAAFPPDSENLEAP